MKKYIVEERIPCSQIVIKYVFANNEEEALDIFNDDETPYEVFYDEFDYSDSIVTAYSAAEYDNVENA